MVEYTLYITSQERDSVMAIIRNALRTQEMPARNREHLEAMLRKLQHAN